MIINDIYAGKPDASDEIRERGPGEFAKNYILPSQVNVDLLASIQYGTPFFIMGDKGTGKTALLHYLEDYVCRLDIAACSSFISFEKDYPQQHRARMNAISSSIMIDANIASVGENKECDYTYIWKWQIYQKLISDNEYFNGGLFEDNENWRDFVSEMSRLEKTTDKSKMIIPPKISFSATANPYTQAVTYGAEIEPVDLSNRGFNATKGYSMFARIIDNADKLIRRTKRTNVPYYIFIDELEAYRGDNNIFFRDLRMIRDLLFMVKTMNDLFQTGTKIICSVRLEIVNAINRFIEPKQLHKIMQGYDERLVWEYTNTNSYKHPIIGIMLRRIQSAVEEKTGHLLDERTTADNWFVPNVYSKNIWCYILENTWHKPRDIVRLLLSAQSKNSKNSTQFNQNTFETFMPVYSKQCLDEIKEEMRALYTAEEINVIIGCLQGYKVRFSYVEIETRIRRLYPNSTFANRTHEVLQDLYRIGFLGNDRDGGFSPRWAYKEQYTLYIDDPWMIIIHPALRLELSVSARMDRQDDFIGQQRERSSSYRSYSQRIMRYLCTVKAVRGRYILVEFEKDGMLEEGYISMNDVGITNIESGDLPFYFQVGDEVEAVLKYYNKTYTNWHMRLWLK